MAFTIYPNYKTVYFMQGNRINLKIFDIPENIILKNEYNFDFNFPLFSYNTIYKPKLF